MTFKECNQNQPLLLPPSFRDFLGEGHEAVILDEFMQELDTKTLEQNYRNGNGGRAVYHPAMLLAVLVYGYMNGIFSSRKIARRLYEDLAFMYLAGSLKPDFRTLARFRKEKGKFLESTMASVVGEARELGLVSFGACSLDLLGGCRPCDLTVLHRRVGERVGALSGIEFWPICRQWKSRSRAGEFKATASRARRFPGC